MTSLQERIETEMNVEAKADLLKMNERIEVTQQILDEIRAFENGQGNREDWIEAMCIIMRHNREATLNREAILTVVSDEATKRNGSRRSRGTSDGGEDGLDRLLDDITADSRAESNLCPRCATPKIGDEPCSLCGSDSPSSLRRSVASSLPRPDPDDGDTFNSDFGG